MWKLISGRKLEKQEAIQQPHQDNDDDSYASRESDAGVIKEGLLSRRKDDRDRNFYPSSTSYSSTSTIAYPNTAGASVASSQISAFGNGNDAIYKSPGLVRNQSMADTLPESNAKVSEREHKGNGNRRSEHRKKRSTSRERNRLEDLEKTSTDRNRRKERKDKRKQGRGHENDMGGSEITETSRGAADFPSQVGNASFQQFPGQFDCGTNGVSAERPLEHVSISSHVQDQFPGQFPSVVAAPYRPPGPGLAAEYYGDAGQSVAEQPGYRQNSPSLIVGAEPHLQPALSEAAPPPEPSASGGVGAAASFFSGEFDADIATAVPTHSASVTNHSRPNMPILASSLPALGSAAMVAASGYVIGDHSSYEQAANAIASTNNENQYPADSSDVPFSQTQNAHHSVISKPSRPGTFSAQGLGNSSHESNINGASSLAEATVHNGNNTTSSVLQSASQHSMQHRHRPRRPLGAIVDFFRDPEGVAQFEEYTEFIGVCRNCFEPGSSPRQAPRKHHFRRRRSDERIARPLRVEKSGRQSSDDERDEKRKTNWVAAGLGGYGLGRLGEGLFRQNKDFDDTYSVKSGRRSPEARNSTIRRHDGTKTRRTEQSNDQTQIGFTNVHSDRPRHSVLGRMSTSSPPGRHHKRSKTTERKIASLRAIHDESISGLEPRRHDRSKNMVRTKSSDKSGNGSPGGPRMPDRKKKNQRGFFSFGSVSSSSSSVDLSSVQNNKRSKVKGQEDSYGAEAALLGLGAAAAALSAVGGRPGPHQKAIKNLVGRKETRGRLEEQTPEEAAWEDESEVGSIDSGLAFGGSEESLVSDHEQCRPKTKKSSSNISSPKYKQSWRPHSNSNIVDPNVSSISEFPTASFDGNKQYHPRQRSSPDLQHVFPVSTSDPGEFDVTKEDFATPSDMTAAVSLPSDDVPLHQPQPRTPISTSIYSSQAPYAHGSAAVAVSERAYKSKSPFNDVSQHRADRSKTIEGSSLRRRDTSPASFDTEPIERRSVIGPRASIKENSSVRFDLPSEDEASHSHRARRRTTESKSDPVVFGSKPEHYTQAPKYDGQYQKASHQSPDGPSSSEPVMQSIRAASDKSWVDPTTIGLVGAAGAAIATATSFDRSKHDESKEERRERRRRERRRDDEADDARRERRRKSKEIDQEHNTIQNESFERAEDDDSREQRRERRKKERQQRERKERSEQEYSTIQAKSSITDVELQGHADQDDTSKDMSVWQEAASKQSSVHEDYGSFFAPTDVLDHVNDQNVKISGANADADIELDYNPTIITVEPKGFRDISDSPNALRGLHDMSNSSLPWPVPKLRLLYPTPPSTRSSTPIMASRDKDADDTDPRVVSSPASNVPARVTWASDPVKNADTGVSDTDDGTIVRGANYAAHTSGNSESNRDEPPETSQSVGLNNVTPAPSTAADDFEFAAALAAGAEVAGFDPSIVTGNSDYHRRHSPPGSDEPFPPGGFEEEKPRSGRKGKRKSQVLDHRVREVDRNAENTEIVTESKNAPAADAKSEQFSRSIENADEGLRSRTSKAQKAKKSKKGSKRSPADNTSIEGQDTAVLSGEVERQSTSEPRSQDIRPADEEYQPVDDSQNTVRQENSIDAVNEHSPAPDATSVVKESKPKSKKGSLWDRVLGKSETEGPEPSTMAGGIREHASRDPDPSTNSYEGRVIDPLQAQNHKDTTISNRPASTLQTSERSSTGDLPGRLLSHAPSRDDDKDHAHVQTSESFLDMRPEPPPPPDAEDYFGKPRHPCEASASQIHSPATGHDRLNQRPSEIHIVDTPQSPKTIASPTAVPVHFRRPMRSFGSSARSLSQTSLSRGQTVEGSPTSAKPRPRSTEFKSSKEFRPLWLVERHGSRQDSVVGESYPSLPSSHSSSPSPSPLVVPAHHEFDSVDTSQQSLVNDPQLHLDEDTQDLPISTASPPPESFSAKSAACINNDFDSGYIISPLADGSHSSSHWHSSALEAATSDTTNGAGATYTWQQMQPPDTLLNDTVAHTESNEGSTSMQNKVSRSQLSGDKLSSEALFDTTTYSTPKRKKDKKNKKNKQSKANAAEHAHRSSIQYDEESQLQPEHIRSEQPMQIKSIVGREPMTSFEDECDSSPAKWVAEPVKIDSANTLTDYTRKFQDNTLPDCAIESESERPNGLPGKGLRGERGANVSDKSRLGDGSAEDKVLVEPEDAARHGAVFAEHQSPDDDKFQNSLTSKQVLSEDDNLNLLECSASDRAHQSQDSAGINPRSIRLDNASHEVPATCSSIKSESEQLSSATTGRATMPEVQVSHKDIPSTVAESQINLDDELAGFSKVKKGKKKKHDRESISAEYTEQHEAPNVSDDLSSNHLKNSLEMSERRCSEGHSDTAQTGLEASTTAKKTKKEKKKSKSRPQPVPDNTEPTKPNSFKSDRVLDIELDEASSMPVANVSKSDSPIHGHRSLVSSANNILNDQSPRDVPVDQERKGETTQTAIVHGIPNTSSEFAARNRNIADKVLDFDLQSSERDSRTLSETSIDQREMISLPATVISEAAMDEDSGIRSSKPNEIEGDVTNLANQEPDDDGIQWASLGKRKKKKAKKTKQREVSFVGRSGDTEDAGQTMHQPESIDTKWQELEDGNTLTKITKSSTERRSRKKEQYLETSNEDFGQGTHDDRSAICDLSQDPPRTEDMGRDGILPVSEQCETDGAQALSSRGPEDAPSEDEHVRFNGSSSDSQDMISQGRPDSNVMLEDTEHVQTAGFDGFVSGNLQNGKKKNKKSGLVRRQSTISAEDCQDILTKEGQIEAKMPICDARLQDPELAGSRASLLPSNDLLNDAKLDEDQSSVATQGSKQGAKEDYSSALANPGTVDAIPYARELSHPQMTQEVNTGGKSDPSLSICRADGSLPGVATESRDHAPHLEELRMVGSSVDQDVMPPKNTKATQLILMEAGSYSINDNVKGLGQRQKPEFLGPTVTASSLGAPKLGEAFTQTGPVLKGGEIERQDMIEIPQNDDIYPSSVQEATDCDHPKTSHVEKGLAISKIGTGTGEVNAITSDQYPIAKQNEARDVIDDGHSPTQDKTNNDTSSPPSAELVSMSTTNDINVKDVEPTSLGSGRTHSDNIASPRQDVGSEEVYTFDNKDVSMIQDSSKASEKSQQPHAPASGVGMPDADEDRLLVGIKELKELETGHSPSPEVDEIPSGPKDDMERPIESSISSMSKKGKKKQKKSRGLLLDDSLRGDPRAEASQSGMATNLHCPVSMTNDIQIDDPITYDASATGADCRNSPKARNQDIEARSTTEADQASQNAPDTELTANGDVKTEFAPSHKTGKARKDKKKAQKQGSNATWAEDTVKATKESLSSMDDSSKMKHINQDLEEQPGFKDHPTHPIISPIRGPEDIPPSLTFHDIIEPSEIVEPQSMHGPPTEDMAHVISPEDTVELEPAESFASVSKGKKGKKTKKSKSPKVVFKELSLHDRHDEQPAVVNDIFGQGDSAGQESSKTTGSKTSIKNRDDALIPYKSVHVADKPPEVLSDPAEISVSPTRHDRSATDTPLSGASADLLDHEQQREYEDEYLRELKKQLSPPKEKAHSATGIESPQDHEKSYHEAPIPSSNETYDDKHQRSISGFGTNVEQLRSNVDGGAGPSLLEFSEMHQHPTALEQIKEVHEPHTTPMLTQHLHDDDEAFPDLKPAKRGKKGKKTKKRDPVIWEDATATSGIYENIENPGVSRQSSPMLTNLEESVEKEVQENGHWDIHGSPSSKRQTRFRDDSNDYFGLQPSSQAEDDVSQQLPSNSRLSAGSKTGQMNSENPTGQLLHSRDSRALAKSSESGKTDESSRPSSTVRDFDYRSVSQDVIQDGCAGAATAGLGATIAAAADFVTKQPDIEGEGEDNALGDLSHFDDGGIEQAASADELLAGRPAGEAQDISFRRAVVDPIQSSNFSHDCHQFDSESKAAIATEQQDDAQLRDSAIHIPETAPIATFQADAQPFRDSGYPETEANTIPENPKHVTGDNITTHHQTQAAVKTEHDKTDADTSLLREVRGTSHADELPRDSGQQRFRRKNKGRASSATFDSDDSADSGFDVQRRRRKQALLADEVGEPSPVSSTTKDRSSGLFDSSPSIRYVDDANNRAYRGLNNANAARSGIESANQHSPHGQNSAGAIEPAYTVEAPPNLHASKSSIFGGPMPLDQQANEGRIPEGDDHSTRNMERTSECSKGNLSLERKGKREAADIGLPDSGVKARRTSHGPDSSSCEAEGNTDSKSAVATPVDVNKHIRNLANRSEGHAGTLQLDQVNQRSKQRQMSNQSTSSNTARDGEWRRQNIGSPDSIHAIIRTPDQMRSSSGQSFRSSGTPPLRRVDRSASGDLRGASRMMFRAKTKEAEPLRDLGIGLPSSSTYDPLTHKGKARGDMADVYEGWGDVHDQSPMSPTRPPSMRKRQSIHFADLEQKLEQLAAEHRSLQHAKSAVDRRLEEQARDHDQQRRTYEDAMQDHKSYLSEKDMELERLHGILDSFKTQVAELTAVNEELHSSRDIDAADTNGDHSFALLASQHRNATRELEELREQHTRLANDHEDILEREITAIREEKDYEIQQLQDELEAAKDQIRSLQQQILESRPGEEHIERDEDYFEAKCTVLCQHVQQWVLRFSKLSDGRACRLVGQLGNESLSDLFDDAILDGSEADDCLQDRIKRRDIFMSVVMSRIFEHIFARYLFGLDREHRKKLKDLDQTLMNNGAPSAVQKWRSTTLGILSSRQAFQQQREDDSEGVVDDIYKTLAAVLPPKKDLAPQIKDSLRRVVTMAVDLHIEMRLQRAEYQMLPPLKPQFDPDTGDLIRKVPFNATMMNERSGDEAVQSNEQLQEEGAVVKIVLFPLVIKSMDDEEQVVVCPAQVLTSKEKDGREDRSVRAIGSRSAKSEPRSEASFAADDNTQMEGAMF